MSDDHTRTQPPADGATGTFGAPDGTGTFSGRADASLTGRIARPTDHSRLR